MREFLPLVAVGVTLLYAIGFLVVNAYLATYGVRELEPIRPRYVAAAIPFLTIVLAAWLAVDAARTAVTLIGPGGWGRVVLTVIFGLAFYSTVAAVTAFLFWSVLFSLESYTVGSFSEGWDQYLVFFRFTTLVILLYWLTRRAGLHRQLKRSSFTSALSLSVLTVVLGMPLSYVSLYRLLPTWIGGGRPDLVQLTLAANVIGCDDCTLRAVRLIDADPQRVLILVGDGPNEHAIELDRAHVIAITHAARVQGLQP